MKQVTVLKEVLLANIKINRDKHRDEYLQAAKLWKDDAIEVMKRNLDRMERNTVEPQEQVPHAPESFVEHYNKAIKMLEMSSEDKITLEEHEFSQLVMDEWNWKARFVQMNSKYLSK